MLDQISDAGSSDVSADDSSELDITFALAQACFSKNDWEGVCHHLKRALVSAPENPSCHLFYACAVFNLGDISESTRHFDLAISLEKNPQSIKDLKTQLLSSPHIALRGFFQGSHAPERAIFMSAAVNLIKDYPRPLNLLEIGSYAGSSLLTWSNAAEKFLEGECHIICVDPWGESGADLYNPTMKNTLESERAYEVFSHNAELCRKMTQVTPIRGKSSDVLPTLEPDSFDLIYIDGSHQYADVLGDIVESVKLIKNRGIICGDDLELQLFQCEKEFVENNKTADFIKDPKSEIPFHPGVTLAVAEYFGEVSNFAGFWAMQKISDRFEKISLSKATGLRPPIWPRKFHERVTSYFENSDELGQII